MRFTLKDVAEAGYIMGLATIGEVANHMRSHYDAYFFIENFGAEMAEFDAMVDSHAESSIFLWLTDEDKARMDDELEKAMQEAEKREALDETQEIEIKIEGEEENKHF